MAERIIVTAAGLILIAGVSWYFLVSGRKRPGRR
jgi:hypothetical protein